MIDCVSFIENKNFNEIFSSVMSAALLGRNKPALMCNGNTNLTEIPTLIP